MALVTFSGYPASGKTRRATQLKEHLETRLADHSYNGLELKVVILSDDSLDIDRSCYDGALSLSPFR
jgi:protein KTI12